MVAVGAGLESMPPRASCKSRCSRSKCGGRPWTRTRLHPGTSRQGNQGLRASARTALVGTLPVAAKQGAGGWAAVSSRFLTGLGESLGPPGYRCRPPQTCHTSGQPLLLPYGSIIEKFAIVSSSLMNSGSSAPRQRHASASCVHQTTVQVVFDPFSFISVATGAS